jgi:putative SOS response-associated peptidase YedK
MAAMCGRYVSPEQAAIERYWHLGQGHNPFPRRFNVAPTVMVPILWLDRESDELELNQARWGLVPHWWSREKLPTFTHNARIEEATTSGMWREPLRRQRCLVPAEGWYEWKEIELVDSKTGEVRKAKQPHLIRLPSGGLLGFAGIMSWWRAPGKEPLLTCSILTRDAVESLADVHDRMPVALAKDAHSAWLDRKLSDACELLALAREKTIRDLVHYPVSTRVNVALNDDATLIEPVA